MEAGSQGEIVGLTYAAREILEIEKACPNNTGAKLIRKLKHH